MELGIVCLEIDHLARMHMPQLNCHKTRERVERDLLGGSRTKACGACDDFWWGFKRNCKSAVLQELAAGVVGNADDGCPRCLRIFQCGQSVGCGSARGDGNQCVPRRQPCEVLLKSFGCILGLARHFCGLRDPPRHMDVHLFCWDGEGSAQFHCVRGCHQT